MAAPLSFDSVYRLLKREPLAPVYYLTGTEDLLKEEVIRWIVDKAVDEQSRDFNLDMRNAGDLTGEDFYALVETPPMLAALRAVIVKDIEQWRGSSKVWQLVHRYLDQPSPTTVLVLTHGAGLKPNNKVANGTVHVRVEPLNPDRLQRWITMRAERANVSLTEAAAQHLLKAVGSDLSQLAMEIEKVAAAATAGDQAVDADTVAALVGVRRGETLQDWVDAVVLREIPKAMDMLEIVLASSGMNGVRMVSALGAGLIGVLLARMLVDSGCSRARTHREVLGALRASRPFGVGNWSDQATLWTRAASAWSMREVSLALRAAYECDRRLKSTTLSDERAILAGLLLQLITVEAAA
jgi:DNA polymerase III delta subunit